MSLRINWTPNSILGLIIGVGFLLVILSGAAIGLGQYRVADFFRPYSYLCLGIGIPVWLFYNFRRYLGL